MYYGVVQCVAGVAILRINRQRASGRGVFYKQHPATHCNTLQPTATHYTTLQHTIGAATLRINRQRAFGRGVFHTVFLHLPVHLSSALRCGDFG